jgi:hypothetical protein
MDTNSDDLSEVERRLAACEPSAAGLDADGMLFAAGRASARRGPMRFVWPALTAGLTATALGLGLWLRAERTERLDLALRLEQMSPPAEPTPLPQPAVTPPEPPSADRRPESSVIAAHRALEQGLDAWPPVAAAPADPPGPPAPDPPVLRVGRPDALPDL